MKKQITVILLILAGTFLLSQESDAADIVLFQKDTVNNYQFFKNGTMLPLDAALELFAECPQNTKELSFYNSAQKTGEILSISGMSLSAGTALFYFGTLLAGNAENFKEIQMYGALSGGILFVSGLISLHTAYTRLKKAHYNYNVWIMGFPAASL